VTQVDHRPHDARISLVDGHVLHERLIHLHFVHRQFLQVAQRRVPCPEVVDRDLHPHLTQPPEHILGPGRLSHHSPLSDLYGQPCRRNVRQFQQSDHRLHEMLVLEIVWRQVHRDGEHQVRLMPGAALLQRRLQHPQAQWFH